MFAFLVPITGIALSSFFFGESLRLTLLIGGVLVLAGVYTVTRDNASGERSKEQPPETDPY